MSTLRATDPATALPVPRDAPWFPRDVELVAGREGLAETDWIKPWKPSVSV